MWVPLITRTTEQQAIVDHVRSTNDNILIAALAGSGKTWTLLEALKSIPQKSILICAFNKRIAEEIKTKLPKMPRGHVVHVKTFHALGLSIIHHHFPGLQVDPKTTENLITRVCESRGVKLSYPERRSAVALLRTFKETFSIHSDLEVVGRDFELFGKLRENQIARVVEITTEAYNLDTAPSKRTSIDFCDMVWMPVSQDLDPPSRYQAIIVDEWQDMSDPQFSLIKSLRAPKGGRLIMAGDLHQAIYGWRGAIGGGILEEMRGLTLKATIMPLTTSFRCSKAAIVEAQRIVPEIKAWDQADDGSVRSVRLADVPSMLMGARSEEIHTFILSRTNADLLDCALYLWRAGVHFQLNAGETMLEPLFDLIDSLNTTDRPRFLSSLQVWYGSEVARAEAADSIAWRERLDEQCAMLTAAVVYVEPSGLKVLLQSILRAGVTGVLMSSVHKVKGLEADRVFLLEETFASRQDDVHCNTFTVDDGSRRTLLIRSGSDETRIGSLGLLEQQSYDTMLSDDELNIEYVAITRTRTHLIWVGTEERDRTSLLDALETIEDEIGADKVDQLDELIQEFADEAARLSSVDPKLSDRYSAQAMRLRGVLEDQ